MSKIRYTLLIGALFLALVLSAVNTAPVFADESTPPEETPTQQTESAQTEETVVETESTVVEEEAPQPLSEVDSAEGGESNPVTEILEQLPEGTEIVVVDENGEQVSLATQQAEETVPLADPRWCPAGAVPPAGCSPYFSSFLDLINWLESNNPAKAGTIWIEAAYDSTVNDFGATDFILNGLVLTNMANYALTINGGWLPNGSNGGSALSTTNLSEFHVPLKILGWNAPVTINNVSINNIPLSNGADYALEVGTSKGAITLNNVEVVNNNVSLAGASLTNNLALVPAGVTVNNSEFSSNTANGLEISSKGIVNIKNVSANDNDDIGASITNTFDVKAQAVNLTGTNTFNYNGKDGLVVFSKGVITLNHINASYNAQGSGVYLDNCLQSTPGLGVCTNTISSGVTIKGTNNFSYNGWDGLRVYSSGVITVSNVIANNNGTDLARPGDTVGVDYDAYGKGMYLDNYGALVTKRGIIVNGTNFFSNNISNGLFAVSKGLITLMNITANKNDCDQIKEGDDTYCAGVYLLSYGGVTQTGYANFIDNDQDGLRITTYNVPVTLTNIFSADNGNDGVEINGGNASPLSNITINGTNIFNNNGRYGMWVYTSGAITLNNINANYNTNSGIILDNTLGSSAKAITIKGVNTFQGNGDTGLTVFSRGAITTYSINSIGNAGQAAVIDNCDEGVPGECQAYYAAIVKGVVTKTFGVSMLGTNYINGNANGLIVDSRGAIVISNLTSIYSTGEGAVLSNNYTNAIGGVSLTGFNNISHNGTYGLEINSYGAVAVANITANYNDISGVEVNNIGIPTKPANVTFTGTNRFNDNVGTGLIINTHGAVTLYNITANGNGVAPTDSANGVYINNSTGSLARAVILYGFNYINDNNGTGLYIDSIGAITIQRVTANNNNGVGARLDNVVSTGTQAVTISGYGTFIGNATNGLQIESNGKVVAVNLNASNNLVHGVTIDTQYGALPASAVDVVISGYNNFNNNGDNGLQIKNDGVITLTNIFANANGKNGAVLDNLSYAGGSLNKTIILNGVNSFSNNAENGLMFSANGNVTLNRLTAFGNDPTPGGFSGSGIVGVFGGGGTKVLTFSCGTLMGNEDYGMNITGATVINLRGVSGQPNSLNVTAVITRACPLP